MGIFGGRKARTDGGAVVSDRGSSRADLDALKQFVQTRQGVEGWIEPQTSVTHTTLLLVAHDGESIRRRVTSAQAGHDFARKKLKIPVYDSNLVPIAARKRDYDLRKAGATSSGRTTSSRPTSARTTPTSAPAPAAPARRSPREMRAIMTLESVAGTEPLPDDPSFDQLMKVYRKARSQAHPDRQSGAREKWDTVEDAARALGLPD
ncbi:hypothetical protein AERO_09950 [Aeromicrobium fastidiosum]|uniref:hypothetical protein n=1 Tax=Aeromicrobium fastidiosum TaxID=52699 RepID=UPI0020234192|nr:hypothetical protein [Aeromicrobium fastidiosum]MCL8251705.1 hypothetical protein [Aeromicrobium fastidiosum]